MSTFPEMFEPDNFSLPISNAKMSNIEVTSYIGRGKYSQVYQGIDIQTNHKVALKVLKPIREEKVKREVKIASMLRHEHILPMLEVMKDLCSHKIIIMSPFYPSISPQDLHHISVEQIPNVMRSLLSALAHCHSLSVMHRDIKPHNLLVHPTTHHAMLIDWGLAQFAMPGRQYSCKVASRYYKAPQLMVGDVFYGTAVDIWGAGCIMAQMIFRIQVLFKGKDMEDQLLQIVNWFSKDKLKDFVTKYRISPDQSILQTIEKGHNCAKQWQSLINPENQKLATSEALDLLQKMLTLDKQERITAECALAHPYFSNQNNQRLCHSNTL